MDKKDDLNTLIVAVNEERNIRKGYSDHLFKILGLIFLWILYYLQF
jgi:hypothetical protein